MPHRFFISNEVRKKVLPSKARQVLISNEVRKKVLPSKARQVLNFLLDLLFPWQCLYCQKEVENDYPLCESCFQQIPIFDDFICPICQRKLTSDRTLHQYCRQKTKLEALGVVSSYQNNILKETIHNFKYNKITSLSQPLSLLMIKFLEQSYFFSQLPKDNLLIIPLPLHLKKKRQRGFNQSELIAKEIANYFYLPCETDILLRVVNNSPQVSLENSDLRKENVKDIFKVNNQESIRNKTIILLDDVYTTGATMEEAAKTLKQNNAKKVIGLVLAKG